MIFHIIHRWSKWSYPVSGYGASTVQFKACLDCRKVKYREVGYAQQIKATDQGAAILSVESEDGNSIEDRCDPVFITRVRWDMWPFKKRKRSSIENFSKDSFDSAMRFEKAAGYAEKPMPKAHDHQRELMDDLVFRLADDLSRGGKFAQKFEEVYGIKRR